MELNHLKELCTLNGVSGDEDKVREYIKSNILPYADTVECDSIGNLIAFKKGTKSGGHTVMISAHMDEVGFIVKEITDDGYLKFTEVGGIDDRILLAKRVFVGEDNIPGVLGVKAVHLQTKSERSSVIKIKDMYIDIGAKDKDEAQKYVKLGDYVAFNSKFRTLGDEGDLTVKAKALDDRLGCAVLMELIKETYENDIYFCFTVQEEVGLRGASVLSRRIEPKIALIIESTTASDVPGADKYEYCTMQGEGPAISIMDRASYSDKELNKFILDIAKKCGILYQFKKTTFGGNDAGAIQTGSGAVKTAVISAPARYIHSPVSTVKKSDIDNLYSLGYNVLKNIHSFNGRKG